MLAALLFIADVLTAAPIKPCSFNTGKNGLWLRYYWYAGKQNDDDFKSMTERLRTNQIRYAYFHVLNAQADGHLHMRKLVEAQKITNAVHAEVPGCMPIAWLYIGSFGKQPVDLSKPEVRKNLVDEALWLTGPCGFDGVQWDYEFAANGSEGLLKLLEETRSALPKSKLLSVATPMWYPGTLWGWSDEYFKQVCARCDQIAVMCYDSYLYFPRAYSWLLSEQTIHASKNCERTKCTVVLGLPTYEDVTLAHLAFSESLIHGMRGVCDGLASKEVDKRNFDGIALFADYTTDKNEWNDYERFWLR